MSEGTKEAEKTGSFREKLDLKNKLDLRGKLDL
jgi:hypothetical protein